LPQGEVKDATVRKKAEPYHPIWETLWKSSVIFGIAVATIVCRNNQQVSWNWRIKEGIPSPVRP
jgi:hypothetical protein